MLQAVQPAIRIENLSKAYRIGALQRGYRTLRETIMDVATAPWRRLKDLSRWGNAAPNGNGRGTALTDTIWALRDVSLEISPGEVVGIIGRNGAGKSTLLKILSRITEPTAGRVEIRGRVGSLLEVGTGFHPELTGRENIYLNGAILGMTRREIRRKFDEIVDFAGVGEFIDTPVKRFSSGMYVRLAFSVAAHLDPEILLVDEVLAVGDATYQRKCIDRMSSLASSGRTVIFISHNMDLIARLCVSAALLRDGQLVEQGPAEQVAEAYLSQQLCDGNTGDLTRKYRRGDGRARFVRLQMVSPHDGTPLAAHSSGNDLVLRADVMSSQAISNVALAFTLKTLTGTRIISSWTRETGFPVSLQPGLQTFECRFQHVTLRPGHKVSVMLWMESNGVIDAVHEAGVIDVAPGEDSLHLSSDKYQGVVVFPSTWSRVE